MAPLPLIHHHHHVNLMCPLQPNTTGTQVFNDSPSLLANRYPSNIHSPTAKSYGEVISEKSTGHEETWEVKQETLQQDFEAWRFGVETNTLRSWTVVPAQYVEYVKKYMVGSGVESVKKYMVGSGSQYLKDSDMVAHESIAYANTLKLSRDGKDAWVFDVDETLLSNLAYFAAHQFGGEGMDEASFIAWAALAVAPPLPASYRLYTHLLRLGFKIFLLTGRYDYERDATEKNLARAGYHSWKALLLRDPEDYKKSAAVYKSEKRLKIEQDGFRIRGNSGDQWSDLTECFAGERTFKLPNPPGERTFKLPNPMYYVD